MSAMSTLVVRPALPQDEIFLYDLYSAILGPQFALAVNINATQREHLIRLQFRGQMYTYTQLYPNSCYHIVLLDSKPVGRLWVAPGDREFRLVDIAMHPGVQSKGLGTAVIQRLQQEATNARLPIRSTVSKFNPGALRFHKRVSFHIVREDEMNYFMEWTPIPIV